MKPYYLLFLIATFVMSFNQIAFGAVNTKWSLESATQRLYEISYELEAAKKEIEVYEQKLEGASKWPNPSIEIVGSEKLRKAENESGLSATTLTINQPIPITRISRQKAVQKEELKNSKEEAAFSRLKLEYDLSVIFHELQLKKAIWDIATQKYQLIKKIQSKKTKRGDLIRFLNPSDKARLRIIKNKSFVDVEQSEGEYNEVLSVIKSKLHLGPDSVAEFSELESFRKPPTLSHLKNLQREHPVLRSLNHRIMASKMQVRLEKSKRFSDPVLSVFTDRDYLGNQIQSQQYYGATISITLPIWDTNSSSIAAAKAEADKFTYKQKEKKIEIEGGLIQSYKHLEHLHSLGEDFEKKILPQFKSFLDLTIKNFSIGESGILPLVDAYNNYYETRLRYLQILRDTWVEFANVRLLSNLHIEDAKI